jgi:hypothetical protein
MSVPEPRPSASRLAFSAALARMQDAHDALAAEVSPSTLLRYETACADARRCFEAMCAAGVASARARWPR